MDSIISICSYLMDVDYIVDNPNQVLDKLLDLFNNGDMSLITEEDREKYYYETEKMFEYMNTKRLVNHLNELLIENEDKIDIESLRKYISFISNNHEFSAKVMKIIFGCLTYHTEDELLEIINEFDDDLYDDIIARILNNLLKNNKLNLELFKKILDRSFRVDVSFFDYLIPKFSSEYIDVLSNYDINVINYLSPEQISQEMIDRAKEDSYFYLTDNSPEELFNDSEYIKKYVSLHPFCVKQIERFSGDDELFQLACKSGLEITYDDFINKGVYSVQLLVKELDNYLSTTKKDSSGFISMRYILDSNDDIVPRLYQLLKSGINYDMTEVYKCINDRSLNMLLTDFDNQGYDISFLLDNQEFMINTLGVIGSVFANRITFEPTDEFVKKFYEAGYSVSAYSTDFIRNSKKMFLESINYNENQIMCALLYCNKEFATKDFVIKSIEKGVNILDNGVNEVTDEFLKDDVLLLVDKLEDGNYKDFVKNIIKKAGYSLFYVEYDNLLSVDVYNCLGEDLLTKLIRNLAFCGVKLDFKSLIEQSKIELFKEFYFMEKKKDDALEFKYLLDFFNDNIDLIENLVNSGMTDEEKKGFREYIFHKDKFFTISNRKFLSDMRSTIFEVNNELVKSESNNIDVLKSIIFSTLFNLGYYEIDGILGIVGESKLASLKNNINNDDYIKLIDYVTPYISFIEFVYSCYDRDKLIEIVNNINLYYINFEEEVEEFREVMGNIELFAKKIYTEELNNSLTKLSDESYIEFDSDSYFLAHVMNAFGNGSKLSDFKNPRFIGRTYICLSAIGRGVNPYTREEVDMDHVTLLFNNVPNNSLISMSSHDMGSRGGNGQMDVYVRNNFDTLFNILDNTKYGVPNEYVVYRESEKGDVLYPCGILVVGDEPSLPEVEAANYLGVPLVKRKKVEKQNRQEYINSINKEEDVDKEDEFYSYLVSKVDMIKENNSEVINHNL